MSSIQISGVRTWFNPDLWCSFWVQLKPLCSVTVRLRPNDGLSGEHNDSASVLVEVISPGRDFFFLDLAHLHP